MIHWPVWVVVCPLLAAIVSILLKPRMRPLVGLLGTLGVLVSVTSLASQVSLAGPQEYAVGGWPAPLGIRLHADGLSAVMLLMSTLVGTITSCFAVGYFASGKGHFGMREREYFWPLWMLLWAALHGLFLSADLFNLYVTLELLSLASVPLVALAGGEALLAALRYLLMALLASMLYLLGVALLYAEYTTLDLLILGERIEPGWTSAVAVSLVLLSLILKTALFPLHFWLPPAHSSAPAPVSALLSALVVKASFYLVFRLWYGTFSAVVSPAAEQLLASLGMLAILWGSVQAIRQDRLKLLIAYSTVAQLGYLFLVFPLTRLSPQSLAVWQAAVLFAFSHALSKGAFFMAAGSIQVACGHDDIARLPGFGPRLPLPFMTIGLASVALMGLPPSGAFMAKWLLLLECMRTGQFQLAAVIVAGSLMAAVYSFRILGRAFLEPPESPDCPKLPGSLVWPPLVLAVGAVLLGLLAHPICELVRVGKPLGITDTPAVKPFEAGEQP
jgi:multicomponent Na+:H+ antiporter subunit D